MATVRAIITDALFEIGVIQPGESLDANDAALALLRFQNQLDAWQADRLTLAVQQRTPFTLASGTSTVTLGPSGADVTMIRPVWLNTVMYVIPGSSPATEVPIGIMSEDAYAALSIKAMPSSLPTLCFYQTSTTSILGSLFFWPQVTQDVDIALYTPQGIGVPVGLTSVVLGPEGYQEAFMYELAVRLASPFGRPLPALTRDMAIRAYNRIRTRNVKPGMLSVDPILTSQSRAGTYNILSDQGG